MPEISVEDLKEMVVSAVVEGVKETQGEDLTRQEMDDHFKTMMEELQNPETDVKPKFTGGDIDSEDNVIDETKDFKTFGEQLQAIVKAGSGNKEIDPRLVIEKATGLGENIPSEGGFLVQPEFAAELIKRLYENGQVASRCRSLPISSNRIILKAVDETSRADGSRHGGVRAYWKDEAVAGTASKPKFREMTLSLKKLIGICYATEELVEDAVALEGLVRDDFAEEFAFKIDDGIINGTGAGQPFGILNSACLVSQAAETSQAADTVKAANVIKMRSRAWSRGRGNSVWWINQNIEPQLHQMTLAVGTGGVPVYLPASGLSGSPYDTLYGRPVIPIEQCPTLGDVGDIIFADMSQYLLATKSGGKLKSSSSVHLKFLEDETIFKFTYRVDGQPTWNSALTPYKGSTLSPFVALAAR